MRSLHRKDPLLRPPVFSYDNIVFVAHSLGGVVVRYLLNSNREEFVKKNVGVLLYASPSFGSKQADRIALFNEILSKRDGFSTSMGKLVS
jgi:predicted alpha/beta hydrolase family esterase